MPDSIDFTLVLLSLFREAEQKGVSELTVNSGELHRLVGDYPGSNHRMPICCGVMRRFLAINDRVENEPPGGNGASLTISYNLPRSLHQRHFVAYHKFDEWGDYYDSSETELAHFSKRPEKQLEKALGQRIWVIGGEQTNRRTQYTLLSYFVPDTIEEVEEGGYNVVGSGLVFDPPVNLFSKPWLDDLLREQKNFSLGINEIKNPNVIEGLLAAERKRQATAFLLPDEIPAGEPFIEGATRQITVNAYERNPKARRACIDHYGATCQVCTFDFEDTYGEIGKGYIHVHHVKPVHTIQKESEVDHIHDLQPVCPNCHAMLHRQNPPLSIDELRAILRK